MVVLRIDVRRSLPSEAAVRLIRGGASVSQ